MRSTAVALALTGAGLAVGVEASGTSTGSTIVYVGIGIVALLLLLGALLVWRCLRNRARQRESPASATYAFQLEIGGASEADRERGQHPRRQHGNHSANPQHRNGLEQHHRALPRDRDAVVQAAHGSHELQPANPYPAAKSPYYDAAPPSPPPPLPGAVAQSRQPTGYQHEPPPAYEQVVQQDKREPAARQERSDSVGEGTESAEADKARAEAREQEVRAHVLSVLESDPVLRGRRIAETSLFFTRLLAKGAFGEVWLAHFEARKVAVKRVLQEKKSDVKEIESFTAEIRLMATFSHPKIVQFVGLCWTTVEDVCAVTEYLSRGDLYSFLKVHVGKLNWRDHKIFLAEDVADALSYLHGLSPKVIHRDLKSKNVLLDNVFRAKLSDFGISRERSVEDTMTAGVGTIYWTAPEVLMGKKYTEKADIYSFGIVMSELDTQTVPYADKRDDSGKKLQGMKILKLVIQQHVRPTLSRDVPPQVRQLIERCVSADPDDRPDAPELLAIVRIIEDDLE